MIGPPTWCVRVPIDGNVYGFNRLPFGWQYSPIICQTVLGYILASLGFSDVLVLHYLDDFLFVGYGKSCVREASATLCDTSKSAGAIISVKSVLEPTQEITWLGKWLSFSRTSGGVQPHSVGWTALVGLWLRAAVLPMSHKQARRILGRFTQAIRPPVGCMPFLAGWWSFCVWGPNLVQNCPVNLPHSLCHCLIMALEGWKLAPLIPFSPTERGTIFLDAAFDVDRYKVGMWAKSLGGRVFQCSPWVRNQQEAELEAMVRGVRICEHLGWPAFCLVGDNESVLEQVASFRA